MQRRGRALVSAVGAAGVLAAAFVAGVVVAGSPEGERMAPPEEMSPEQMMAAWQQANAKGEHHEHLKAFIGSFDVKVSFQMLPDTEVYESEGESEGEWILDGRFVRSTFKGESFGVPFTGISMTGYANATGKYQTVWMDSMGNSMQYMEGTCRGGRVFTYTGTETDPMTRQTHQYRDVLTVHGHDRHTFERFYVDGEMEHRGLWIEYTRK
ncbi:MAG: DUF1579 family protein [Phycisphaerales bacterium]|nr:DUF1579 family protein [Phycisphaerales bacterium]